MTLDHDRPSADALRADTLDADTLDAGTLDVAGLDVSPDAAEATTPAPAAAAGPKHSVTIRGRTYPVQPPNPRDPRLWVAGVTLSIHALGQFGLHFQLSVPQLLAAMLTCAIIEVTLTFRRSKSFVWPASALLTASGVALILRLPDTPPGDHWSFHKWWVYAAVAAAALSTKYLFRYRGSPLFNPSNVALVVTFIVFGSSRVEPLDFWWAPLNGWMIAAYAIIVIGGSLIGLKLRMFAGSIAFWLTLAVGTALVAAFGHCITARWAFAPVCGFDYWKAIVFSPEVLIFMFFMVTDPKTVPRGRVGHVSFCVLVGIASVLLMAPQTTEFWSKVGLLGGLTLMCLARPLLERWLPERDSEDDRIGRFAARVTQGREGSLAWARAVRIAAVSAVVLAIPASVVAAGIPGRATPVPGVHEILGRVPHDIDPSTLPEIEVDQEVLDWNHEITGAGAQQIVLTTVENLELEKQALLREDPSVLTVVDHGDRLDAMNAQLQVGIDTGVRTVRSYQFERVHVTLLVPFGRQDGLSLGLESTGTVTTQTYAEDGSVTSTTTEPFATTFVTRRATGDRWLIVDELPLQA